MSGILKITALATCLVLAGCTTLPLPSNTLSTDTILLDQVNAMAKNNPDWFTSGVQEQEKLTQKYKGKLRPELAIYLEMDIYIYEDGNLSAYLLEIVDRLLQGWEGVKPKIEVVVESGNFFSAFVDELHLLHVKTGLLRKIENEDQLASIMAHELSHVLLRHNSEKSLTDRTEEALDIGGVLMASGGEFLDSISGSNEYREAGQEGLLGFQSLGFVWADMLAPSWSRENEKEADLMGLDLLIRANYNYEEFPGVIEKIADAETQRSERLQQFNKLAHTVIDKNRKKIKTSLGVKLDKYMQDMGAAFGNLFVEEISSQAASMNKSHDDRVERIDAIKTYLQEAHGGGDLPPESGTEKFSEIVGGKVSKARLNQDLAALEVIDALKNKDIQLATSKLAEVKYNSRVSPLSCCMAKSSMDISTRKHDPAVKVLDGLAGKNTSPVEAYLKLAELYSKKSNYTQAEASLKLGIETIGRDYKFLPMLIQINKSSGNISAAEEYTLRCKHYDNDLMLTMEQLGSAGKSEKNSYYQKCAAVLGYDVLAKREKKAGASKPTGFGKALHRILPFPQ